MDTVNPRKLSELKTEVEIVKVSEINSAGRSRKDYGDVSRLQVSIKEKGLIQPLVIKHVSDDVRESTGFKYFLLAGGRRFKAIKNLEWDEVPARIYPVDLDGYEIRSIELEENLKRKDLTDAERIKMIKMVHSLWIEKYGEKETKLKDDPGHSKRDTAKRLGISHTKVNKDLEIAEWLERVPELEKLKDRKKIKAAISEAKKRVRRKERLKSVDSPAPSKDIKTLEESYINGDFLEEVKSIPDGTVDLVEIDIDYPMDVSELKHKSVSSDKKSGRYKGIDKNEYPKLMKNFLESSYRILDEGGWCITWFGIEYREKLLEWADEVGFKTRMYHGDWYKGENYANCRNPEYLLKHSCEHFFYFSKGTARLNKPHADHFGQAPIPPAERIHPYEKPVSLMKRIIETFVPEKSRIVSACAGSGNTLMAGYEYNCNVWGTDLGDYKADFIYKVRQTYGK